PLRCRYDRQISVQGRHRQHRLRHQRSEPGVGSDRLGQHHLGSGLGAHHRAGRQGAGSDHHQLEDRRPREDDRRVLDRGVGGARQRDPSQGLHGHLLGQRHLAQCHTRPGWHAIRGAGAQQQDGHQRFTADDDPSGGGSLANWDDTFALVLGNETTGDRQWLGEIRFLAIHDSALTPAQVLQNFNAGVGQKYFLLFDVSSIVGIPESYIMMTAEQYDNYSYLFFDPTFISLTANAQPQSIAVKGIRIGINGSIPTVGQSFSTVNTTIGGSAYSAADGQLLSNVGAVIGVDLGVTSDMLFLSFDQLGNQTHVYVDPVVPPNPPATDDTPQPDLGVHTYAEVNASMSVVTGVPVTDSVVAALYASE